MYEVYEYFDEVQMFQLSRPPQPDADNALPEEPAPGSPGLNDMPELEPIPSGWESSQPQQYTPSPLPLLPWTPFGQPPFEPSELDPHENSPSRTNTAPWEGSRPLEAPLEAESNDEWQRFLASPRDSHAVGRLCLFWRTAINHNSALTRELATS